MIVFVGLLPSFSGVVARCWWEGNWCSGCSNGSVSGDGVDGVSRWSNGVQKLARICGFVQLSAWFLIS